MLDDTDNRILWSGEVHTDQRIVIDPDRGVIRRNGETVNEPRFHRDHRYVIKFDQPGGDRDRDDRYRD